MRRAVYVLNGGVAATAGLVTAFLAVVVGGLGCSGTDASEPSDAPLCDGARLDVIFWITVAGMIVAPVFGSVVSFVTADRRAVIVGCAVAVVTLAGVSVALASLT